MINQSPLVERARELLARITPWPWHHESSAQRGHTVWGPVGQTGSMQVAATHHAEFDRVNAEFIAAAPDLVEGLCDENERQRKALKSIERQWHKGVSKHEEVSGCSGCVARAALSKGSK